MRELTEKELKLFKNEDILRESINRIERISKDKRSKDDQDLLEALLDYRQKNCTYPGAAYYDFFDTYYLFD